MYPLKVSDFNREKAKEEKRAKIKKLISFDFRSKTGMQ